MNLSLSTYLRVVRLALTDRPTPRRLAVHGALLGLLPAWSLVNDACLWLDRRLYPEAGALPVPAPLFLVGNARSGTTLLHRLLCLDDEHFVHFKAWEILLPAIVQRRCVASLRALDRSWLGGQLAQGLDRWERGKLAALDGMHATGLNAPEEDEFLMATTFLSPVINVLFPYPEALDDLHTFDDLDARVRHKVMGYYRRCVQNQLFVRGSAAPRALVSKNPAFVCKLRTLRETFPAARFVYLLRDPRAAIPSLMNLLRKVWVDLGIPRDRAERAARQIYAGCLHDYRYALERLRELPASAYRVVHYQRLVADPQREVEALYEHLGRPLSPAFRQRLARACAHERRYRSAHSYSLAEFGVDPCDLDEAVARLQRDFPDLVPADFTDP